MIQFWQIAFKSTLPTVEPTARPPLKKDGKGKVADSCLIWGQRAYFAGSELLISGKVCFKITLPKINIAREKRPKPKKRKIVLVFQPWF